MIVLADADLDIAASAAVGQLHDCGQVCLSVERLFVEESVAESFAALCVAKNEETSSRAGQRP